jgi:hypothetical protein
MPLSPSSNHVPQVPSPMTRASSKRRNHEGAAEDMGKTKRKKTSDKKAVTNKTTSKEQPNTHSEDTRMDLPYVSLTLFQTDYSSYKFGQRNYLNGSRADT